MKKIRSAHIVAIVFGLVLLAGITGFLSINSFLKPFYSRILYGWSGEKSIAKNVSSIEESVEDLINRSVGFRNEFVQVNGFTSKLLGKSIVEDTNSSRKVIRLSNGYLSFLETQLDDSNLKTKANNISNLNDYLSNKGINLLYVQAPSKIDKNNPLLPIGVEDYSVDNCERFYSMVANTGVDTLSLIDVLRDENTDWYSMFFKTDHHWTNEAGFWAYGEISKYLSENYEFDIDESHLDINNYTVRTYEKSFLGSLGKRTGSTYSGLDDISFIIPNFETSFEYYRSGLSRSGKFEDCLLFESKHLTGSLFDNSPYSGSLDGDYDYIKITNNLNPDGKKVLLIKDSYADPVATHLALDVSQLEIIDPRLIEGDKTIVDYIEESNPDVVIIMYSSQQLFKDVTFEFGV